MREKKVLVVGAGGREHALAWRLAQSPQVEQVFIAPGNAGTAWPASEAMAAAARVPIASDDLPALLAFAKDKAVDLTVVGPEVPLAQGIVDRFSDAGLAIFGPSQAAAQLEASKAFAKQFMVDVGIPTGDFAIFEDAAAARRYVMALPEPPVIKASGLAAGKGVLVCTTKAEALAALDQVMVARAFGDAGATVVVEERLTGPEISILAFCDGQTVVPMVPARDHKRVFAGDTGPNTGGMGAYAPAPDVAAQLVRHVVETVLQPAVDAMAARGTPYAGVLYAGLMLTAQGPQVLEFNCRFGDPETQVVLPLLKSDLYELLVACVEGRLDEMTVRWRPQACATVVMASPGYPGAYPRGLPIDGVDEANALEGVIVFHAGTKQEGRATVSNGGRVLAVSAVAPDLAAALRQAYAGVAAIRFEGAHFRRDIGQTVPLPAAEEG